MMQIKKYKNISINDAGVITKYNMLHDSIFVSITDNVVIRNSTLELLSYDYSTKYKVLISNILISGCDNWRFENIVFDLSILDANFVFNHSKKQSIEDSVLKAIYFLEEYNYDNKPTKKIMDIFNRFKNGELIMVEVSPSYGAYYVAFAEDIEIIESIA